MNTTDNTYTIENFLSPADCNAQQEMSLPLLAQQLIDIATAHANALGIGYSRLLEDNVGWVLSRFAIDVTSLPRINSHYRLTTWVESINRHFSERIVEIADGEGNPMGYARMIWVAIDFTTRRPVDLSPYITHITPSKRRCPAPVLARLGAIGEPDVTANYTFRFSDIDFNRHVNSTRYIQVMLDQWSLDFFDHNRVSRIDIYYMAEAHYGETVEILRKGAESHCDVELKGEGTVYTRARIQFAPRQ